MKNLLIRLGNITLSTSLSSTIPLPQANISCTLTHDVPFTKTNFLFIIPSDTKQSCNIYGPTCQPGSITVSSVVSSDCHASLVSVPCSSYLASKSTYVHAAIVSQTAPIPWLTIWEAGFGRSPECHSYLDLLHRVGDGGPWTLSERLGKEPIDSATEVGACHLRSLHLWLM